MMRYINLRFTLHYTVRIISLNLNEDVGSKTSKIPAIVGRSLLADTSSRFDRTPTCDRQTDGQTQSHNICTALPWRHAVKKTTRVVVSVIVSGFSRSSAYREQTHKSKPSLQRHR